MADRAMLESSMLLHRDSAHYLLALARTGPLEVIVSDRLLEAAASDPDLLARRLGPYVDVPPIAFDRLVLRHLVAEIRPVIETYRADPEFSEPFYRALLEATQDDLVAGLLYDEWSFLTSQSWLFSKTRRAFDLMVEAGGTAVQMSQRSFDRLVRKTLKKSSEESLSPGNRVRAAAKWVAVGGPAILSLVEPISAAASTVASGYFLLVDP